MIALQKTIGSARLARQIIQRSMVSTPPTVKVSFAEKLLGGIVLAASIIAIPTYISVNIKHYRGE